MKSSSPKHNFLQSGGDIDDGDNLIRVDRVAYVPGQVAQRAHASLARTRICRGGLGSGKTRFACEHVNALALQYPGSLHFVGRRDITSLKVTTQKEFLESVVAPETIQTFNVNDNILFYKNGSQILFRETKDKAKVKSLQLTSVFLDEADENESPDIWSWLEERLRQKFTVDGEHVFPPYAFLLVFNPTSEEHWLHELANRKDISVEDFRFSTYDNAHNLPPDYIPNLIKKLPPWEVARLVEGHWGRSITGKPVYHGFTYDSNVRPLKIDDTQPLIRGWDFGYSRPCAKLYQVDPWTGRLKIFRELLGHNEHLFQFVPRVLEMTESLVGPSYPIFDYCDPHGADKKDSGPSSVEYLRIHHGIHCIYRRERIATGMDEIQHKIITSEAVSKDQLDKKESLFLVDPSCKYSIAGYMGGYHRDELGQPKKDGYYDHGMDVDRYVVVNTMNAGLAAKRATQARYKPRNRVTGY